MSRKNRRPVVRIVNPHVDRAAYTTMRSAAEMVKRGVATYEPGVGLTLIANLAARRSEQKELLECQREASIVEARGGVIFWNGCDTNPKAAHPPVGKGRAPHFPRPDQFPRFAMARA